MITLNIPAWVNDKDGALIGKQCTNALTVCFNNKYHRPSVLIFCLFSGHIRGNGGCKLKTIESRTNCKVFVNRFKPATGRMKVTIEIQNEESDPNNAVTRLIGSIMEYTKDKHTD
jgi:hypothetical protein